MNTFQRRLLTILKNIDEPATAYAICQRCQLPQSPDLVASNLRGLVREGKAREWAHGSWVHLNWSESGRQSQIPKTNGTKRVKKVAATKKPVASKPAEDPPKAEAPAQPSAAVDVRTFGEKGPTDAERINDELALMSDLREMAESVEPHQVEDAQLKVVVLRALQGMATPRVAEMLERVCVEDLLPFAEGNPG